MATAKSKSSAGAKAGASRNTGKKQTAARKRKPAAKEPLVSMPAVGVIIMLIGAFAMVCLLASSNAPVIVGVRSFINGTFGKLSVIAMALTVVLGMQTALGERWPLRKIILFQAAVAFFLIATLIQVFNYDTFMLQLGAEGYVQNYNGFLWKSYTVSRNVALGGGWVGGLLSYPMMLALDKIGSVLILFFAIFAVGFWLIRTLVPSLGDKMGNWMGRIWGDYATYREERAAKREAALAEQQQAENEALLVPLPEELRGEPVQEARPAIAKGKRKAMPARAPQEEPAPVMEPPVEQIAPRKRADAQNARRPAAQLPQRKSRLYIENDEPGNWKPADAAYDEYDAERYKYASRPSRKDPNAIPEFIIKRREQFDAQFGAQPAQAPGEEANPELEYELSEAQPLAGRLGDRPRQDALWEEPEQAAAYDEPEQEEEAPMYGEEAYEEQTYRQETAYAPTEPVAEERSWEPPAPQPQWEAAEEEPWEPRAAEIPQRAQAPSMQARQRPAAYTFEDPMNRQPVLDPQERLDRPDWKPPEPVIEESNMANIPEYRKPPFSLLLRDENRTRTDTSEADAQGAQKLEETLASFGVSAKVIRVVHGPAITRYELQPAPGVKVSKIVGLTDDIALNMAAVGVRIEAPIPGKAAIGIEIANEEIQTVLLRDVLESEESRKNASKLAVALGKDVAGKRIIADLARMPHLLIAGATGSGKSVCINTIITSIIYRATPEEVRLILIDPKKVELAVYNGIPHLLVPVVTDPKKASGALAWAVMEMDERYKLFADMGVRDIKGYNAHRGEDRPLMPQIVVVIDELSDLMLVAPGEVEESICRLAQLARACGIYLVIATQRPSVNVITGIIKANIPSRIAFAVSSQVDSRTILDTAGADKLLGKGDMLYAPSGGGKPMRVQGCFVSDDEVNRVVSFVKERHEAEYNQEVINALDSAEEAQSTANDGDDGVQDALFEEAVEMAIESGQVSISMIQRRLRVGYARAGRLVDDMARRGIVGPADGAKPREVLMTREEFNFMFRGGKPAAATAESYQMDEEAVAP